MRGFLSAYILFTAIIFSYCGVAYPLANGNVKNGRDLDAQDATVSILRMLANADFLPVEIREVLVAALSQKSVTKDFEAWKSVVLEKLNHLDDDEHDYKHYIITIIKQSLRYTTLLHPIEDLLSRVKVPGTEFTGVEVFQAFNLAGEFINLIKDKQNSSYSLKLIPTMAILSPGDCIAMKMWTGWWTFMIVTNNNRNGDVQVVCYVATNSSDCIQSELEFYLGFQKSLSLQEVTLTSDRIREVYLVEFSNVLTLSPSETVERAKSRINDTVQGWNELFSHTSEHFASWAKTGQARSYQVEEIWWQLKKQVFNAKIRRVFSVRFGERVFLTGTEAVKSIAGAIIMETAQTTEERLSKEAIKQGAKFTRKEAMKHGVKNAGKETSKQGAKQAGKETLKQGAKQAGKQTLKQGAKQAGKETLKQGAKQAGKQTLKQGAKQAGKETLKQGGKQAGKQTLKQGGKQTVKQGAKHAGRIALGATVVVELAFLGYDLYSDYQLYVSGNISRKEFCKRATSSSGGSVGSVGGAAAGAAVGTAFFPGVGTFLGGVVGGVCGYFGGKAVGSKAGDMLKHFCEEDNELSEDFVYSSESNDRMDFYFHSNDSETGEEIPMKGLIFPVFGNIQTVCWENLNEGNSCYCTVMTE